MGGYNNGILALKWFQDKADKAVQMILHNNYQVTSDDNWFNCTWSVHDSGVQFSRRDPVTCPTITSNYTPPPPVDTLGADPVIVRKTEIHNVKVYICINVSSSTVSSYFSSFETTISSFK